MKQVSILLLWAIVTFSCGKQQISPYQMRVANQTNKDLWRVISYYDGGGSQPLVWDFGFVANKSSSEYINVSGPNLPYCDAIEVTKRDRSVRRPREADCRLISFKVADPGKYTLYISQLSDTGFEAVVKKD